MAMSRWRGAGAAALCALALLLTLAACNSGSSGGSKNTPTPSDGETPSATESPTASPEVTPPSTPTTGGSVIDGVTAYVQGTGLGGEPLEMADPVNCNAFFDPSVDPEVLESNEGKVCIDFFAGEFTESEGVLQVLIVGAGRAWNLTMALEDLAWHVTGEEETEPRLQPLE
jgi:hypothetical protein